MGKNRTEPDLQTLSLSVRRGIGEQAERAPYLDWYLCIVQSRTTLPG